MPSSSKSNQKERLLNKALGILISALDGGDKDDDLNGNGPRELVSALANWGNKNKDELVKILGRELGQALGTVLKEPFELLLKGKKIQITVELVSDDKQPTKRRPTSTPRKNSKKPV